MFFAFEGGDGSGKTTQTRLLANWLTDIGYTVVQTYQPGATSLGQKLRTLLLDPATELDERAEALLYAADKAEHAATVILPALDRGDIVVCDRYIDSSRAYQGYGSELSVPAILEINRWATRYRQPDLTIICDIDPQIGLARARAGGPGDRIEAAPVSFHERVRAGFLAAAQFGQTGHPRGNYLVVDAAKDPDVIAHKVQVRVSALLAWREKQKTRQETAGAP